MFHNVDEVLCVVGQIASLTAGSHKVTENGGFPKAVAFDGTGIQTMVQMGVKEEGDTIATGDQTHDCLHV